MGLKKIAVILLVIFLANVAFGYTTMVIHEREMKKLKAETIVMKEMLMEVEEVRAQYYHPELELSKRLQFHTYIVCKRYKIDYELVLAVMMTESGFDIRAVNDNGDTVDRGLMQINSVNMDRFYELGYTDIFDPYQNIEYGIRILADRKNHFDDIHAIVGSYNMGVRGYREYDSKKTNYSIKVVSNIKKVK